MTTALDSVKHLLIETVKSELLLQPVPKEISTVLESAVQNYPGVSILQGTTVEQSGKNLVTEIVYTVFVPLPEKNCCIVQKLHHSLLFTGSDGIKETTSKEAPVQLSLSGGRHEWNTLVGKGWSVYQSPVVS